MEKADATDLDQAFADYKKNLYDSATKEVDPRVFASLEMSRDPKRVEGRRAQPQHEKSESVLMVKEGKPSTDLRTRVANVRQYPYSTICLIRSGFANGISAEGTGALIGLNMILTCAHVVWDTDGKEATTIEVYLKLQGWCSHDIIPEVSSYHYIESASHTAFRDGNDVALIILKQNVGAYIGHLTMEVLDDEALASIKQVTVCGYPGDKYNDKSGYNMYECSGKVKPQLNNMLSYEIDTNSGESGSPVFYKRDGKYYTIGIHVHGGVDSNKATRITTSVVNYIKHWVVVDTSIRVMNSTIKDKNKHVLTAKQVCAIMNLETGTQEGIRSFFGAIYRRFGKPLIQEGVALLDGFFADNTQAEALRKDVFSTFGKDLSHMRAVDARIFSQSDVDISTGRPKSEEDTKAIASEGRRSNANIAGCATTAQEAKPVAPISEQETKKAVKPEDKDGGKSRPINIGMQNQKKCVRLLLLGKSGAGKSTLINAMYNFVNGVRYNQEKLFLIPCKGHPCNVPKYAKHNSESFGSQDCSQTQDSHTYYMENKSYKIWIIDTPGLGDTQGIEKDQKNVTQILKGIECQADVNAICLVAAISDRRCDAYYKYYIQEIKKLLPAECHNNFIICFTHGTNDYEDSLPALKRLDIDSKHIVAFQNVVLKTPLSALLPEYERIWRENGIQFISLFETALLMKPVATIQFKELAAQRTQFSASLNEHIDLIRGLEEAGKKIELHTANIAKLTDIMKENQEWEIEEEYLRAEKNEASSKNTQCNKCISICHKDCQLSHIYENLGDPNLLACWCMDDNRCKACSCTVEEHYHAGYVYKMVSTKRKIVITAKKNEFEAANSAKLTLEEALKSAHMQKLELSKRIEEMLKRIAQLYFIVKRLSLLPYNDAYEEYIMMAIHETEQEIESPEKLRKMAELKSKLEYYQKEKQTIEQVSMSVMEAPMGRGSDICIRARALHTTKPADANFLGIPSGLLMDLSKVSGIVSSPYRIPH
jgi:V8-like Glu-specific endopeptidase/GTP-binding protein EngB required for normal cell division